MLDPDIDDLHAILRGELLQTGADVAHHLGAFGAEQGGERPLAEFVAQRGAEQRLQLILHALFGYRGAAGRDHRLQRVDDAEAGIGVHLQAGLVGREHRLVVEFDIEHALVDPHQPIDEGHARGQARAGLAEHFIGAIFVDRAHGLLKAQHHRLARLGHDREGAGGEDQQHQGEHAKGDGIAEQGAVHWATPGV